jgi:hypothetical protein
VEGMSYRIHGNGLLTLGMEMELRKRDERGRGKGEERKSKLGYGECSELEG